MSGHKPLFFIRYKASIFINLYPGKFYSSFHSQTFSLTPDDTLSTFVSITPTRLLRKEILPLDVSEDVL